MMTSNLLALLAGAFTPIPILLYKYGERIREPSEWQLNWNKSLSIRNRGGRACSPSAF
jgi:hypothetical protein